MRRKFIPLVLAGPLVAAVSIVGPTAEVQAGCTVSSYLTEGRRSSDHVRCLQTSLNEKGYNSGPVDGWFGPVTRAAVVSYQTANGLVVDGEVGSQTAGSLGVWSAPAPQAARQQRSSSSGNSQSSGRSSGGGGGTVNWDRIAACESGGNWSHGPVTNSSGTYSGGLMWNHRYWLSNGGGQYAQYPFQASKSQQIAISEAASGGSLAAIDRMWQCYP